MAMTEEQKDNIVATTVCKLLQRNNNIRVIRMYRDKLRSVADEYDKLCAQAEKDSATDAFVQTTLDIGGLFVNVFHKTAEIMAMILKPEKGEEGD